MTDKPIRDVYVRGKLPGRDPPVTVLRHLDAVPGFPERTVLDMKTIRHATGVATHDATLAQATGHAFADASGFPELRARVRRQQLRADSTDHPDGFSFSTQDLFDNFELRSPSPR